MDSLTQAVVGAVVGELVLGKKLGWRGAAWGAFFGTVPDLDVIALPFLDPAAGIHWHRGLSHSILIMVLAGVLLARPLSKRQKLQGVTSWEMGWMVFWAWSTHALVDCFTTYGTQVFEPFSDYRVAMNTLFIVDPLFTLPMLVGLVMVLRMDPENFIKRRRVMTYAVCVSCIYFAFALTMKAWAKQNIEGVVISNIPNGKLVAVAPSSFNTILWRGLAEADDGYYLIYWSPFDDEASHSDFIAKNRELACEFEKTEVLNALKWFSRGHWIARKGADGTIVIIDMRFTEIRDPNNGTHQPIFQWHLSFDDEGGVKAPMLRPRGLDYPAAISLLWRRIGGEREVWDGFEAM